MAEAFGVRERGQFYEEVGALRDVFQNHLLQVLALLTMEPPSSGDGSAIEAAKVTLLEGVLPLRAGDVVRGQYDGYRNETGVAADSPVETYVAARLVHRQFPLARRADVHPCRQMPGADGDRGSRCVQATRSGTIRFGHGPGQRTVLPAQPDRVDDTRSEHQEAW
jgi:hypothetical protein